MLCGPLSFDPPLALAPPAAPKTLFSSKPQPSVSLSASSPRRFPAAPATTARRRSPAPRPSTMAEPIYKVPAGFDLGIYHTQERDGRVLKHQDDNVAHLQKCLVSAYDQLAYVRKLYRQCQNWLYRAPPNADTTYMEDQKKEKLVGLRNEWERIVDLMAQLLKAGVVPLPPVKELESAVSVILGVDALLCDAAIASVGGQKAVDDYKVAAVARITEAITRASPLLMADSQEFLINQQQEAAQREADAKARPDKADMESAQGPSAAAGRRSKLKEEEIQDAEERRKEALEKLKAKLKDQKEKRRGRS